MAEQKDHPQKPAASGAPKGTKNVRGAHSGFAGFMERIHSVNMLYFLAGMCQMVLGAGVVLVSILGLLRPFWLSTLFSIAGSITTMIGIYVCYSAMPNHNRDTLLRDAMRRIVEEQN